LQGFGEQVFLVDRHFALHPRLPHQNAQWCNQLIHHVPQTVAQDLLLQGLTDQLGLIGNQPTHPDLSVLQLCNCDRSALAAGYDRIGVIALQQTLQLHQRQRHHLAGPMAGVQQALEQTQTLQLIVRVSTLPQRVTPGLREAVPALPDTQGVLAKPGFPLDFGNGPGLFCHGQITC